MVELVAVIGLLGVLSAVALSRTVKPSAFEAAVASAFVQEELRFARRIAVNRQDVDVSARLTLSANAWTTQVLADGVTVLRERSAERDDATLTADGVTLAEGDSLTVAFRGDGELLSVDVGATTVDPADGVGVTIAAEGSRELCLYPSGYTTGSVCV